ncbi:MAG: hypothetical protein JO327_00415 [Nitrososphaeraceae archaeon]|nr:hypothetical protein [Nitrososphaeraceae archaeon]MBV9666570.1 hypothetical protein [Nitrososphaeraceae archaeon]
MSQHQVFLANSCIENSGIKLLLDSWFLIYLPSDHLLRDIGKRIRCFRYDKRCIGENGTIIDNNVWEICDIQ